MNARIPQAPQAPPAKQAGSRAVRRRSAATKSALTPAMRQYREQKAQVGEAILFFRMGDFYETFYEDAKTVSRVLGLTLTARSKDSAEPVPLAGVPYHAVEGYIAKLVRAGYKVAISEQVEDPRQAKGIVRRAVDRVITPGTLTDDLLLDDLSNNYLAALCPADPDWGGQVGLACVELASGRFFAQMLSGAALADELVRLAPAEILVPEAAWEAGAAGVGEVARTESRDSSPDGGTRVASRQTGFGPAVLREMLALDTNADRQLGPRSGPGSGAAITPRPALAFDPHQAERTLGDHFNVATMAGFGFEEFDASLCAAAAVLDYLKETQRTERQDDEVPEGRSKSGLHHITAIVPRRTDCWVLIDQATLRALEVDRSLANGSREGTLLASIDMTVGPMGGRRLRQWLLFPLCSVAEIRARQEAIEELRGELRIADCGSRIGDGGGGGGGAAIENRPSGTPGRARPDSEAQRPGAEQQSSNVERQSSIVNRNVLARVREMLGRTGDLERITARLGIGRASPRDMVGLGRALGCCGELAGELRIVDCGLRIGEGGGGSARSVEEQRPDVAPQSSIVNRQSSILLAGLADALAGHDDLAEFLDRALQEEAPAVTRDGGFIADGYDEELDRLRHVGRAGHEWLAEFQARESKRTGIPTLKVGYNSVFGYYLEVTHQHSDKVPAEYVRKQTVRNAERYITDDLKRHESEVLGAAERAKHRELKLFDQVRERAAQELVRLTAAADALATLDALAGLAELSRRRNYCRPEILDGGSTIDSGELPTTTREGQNAEGQSSTVNLQSSIVLEVVDGRHPVLDVILAERFVPNDCRLADDGDRMLLITGPNMAGKSTYIRQVALLVLLAQTGSWVPAKSMRFTPVDRVFARVGAGDELVRGKSTFMVEMVETARILHTATARSLVILDELGRGTSTYDGLALAWAITEHLAQRIGCRTLFATHYHELTELAEQLDGVANFNVAVREELRPSAAGRDVVFLHRIVPGATDRSYGVHVAAMAGLPASVLKRGEAILVELEGGFAGRSRSNDLAALPGQDPGQLPLFPGPEPMPDWWGPLVDALGEIDVDRTAPLEALRLLQRLQRIARGE